MKAFILKYVDVSTAWKAALFLGLVVYAINFSHGALAALPAALKQAVYTLFASGFIVRLCENLITRVKPMALAWPLAILVPTLVAVGLTFLVHSLRGTPEPFYSTLPTLLVTPPAFAGWAWRCLKNQPAQNA
jgi:hypothetical protein